jgi:hypothetical protein
LDKIMNKKLITISIVTAIIFIGLLPSTVSAEKNDKKENGSFALCNLYSVVDVNWSADDFDEPILPRGNPIYTDLDVSYSISKGGLIQLFSNLALSLQEGKKIDVNLEVVNKPEWCEASFDITQIPFEVKDEEQTESVTMTITVDETAPAYQQEMITISASVEPVKGPLGLLTMINGFEQQFSLSITPAYLPLLDPEVQGPEALQISPYNETKIPIDITNYGNDLTTVLIDVVNSSDSFNVSIAEKVNLEAFGDNTTVYLSVLADHKFDVENIVIEFTPARAQDLDDKGQSQTLTLQIENDGSYVEKDEGIKIDIDPTILTLVIIIILLAVLNVYLLIRKKQ